MLKHLNPTQSQPSKVLILGAKGFLALHLRTALERVRVDCRSIGSTELDLTHPDQAGRLARLLTPESTVVMLSAMTPDKGRDFRVFMQNLRMAETVCLALEEARCRHFIYISSDAVYDADKVPLDEDSSREPVDLYALTHTAREMLLGSMTGRLEIPYCVLRPTNVYGPGDTHNNYGPNRFVRTALREGEIVIYGRGEERRSQIYVDDAISLIVNAILRQSVGTLNLATRPTLSFMQVAEMVIRNCPGEVRLRFEPRTIPAVHRPYKPTQIFRFISRLGRKIGPIVHRPYAVGAIFDAFPEFRYTPAEEAIRIYLKAVQSESANGGPRA